jgi:hypothetical protein
MCAVKTREKQKENNMNIKGIIAAIVMAMLVMTMFTSTAMAITVDGMVHPADEWNSWKLADDEDQTWTPVNGYDLLAVWQHYDEAENKLYFRYDTDGIAGDSDGDGNPDTLNDSIHDQTGVGDSERYLIGLSVDGDDATGTYLTDENGVNIPGFDITILYKGNSVEMGWHTAGITAPPDFVAVATIGAAPFTKVVEFSINNVTAYMNPRQYVLYGYAGSSMDGPNTPEDPLQEPVEVIEFNFTFRGICCYNMEFNGTDSFGNVSNHTWDFGEGPPVGPIAGPPGVITHQYSSGGTYTVKLSGYNQHGLYTETTKSVYVDKGPTADTTWDSKKIDANTPTSVTFDGTPSHADPNGDPPRTITYKWEFSDTYPDQSTAVVTRAVTLAEGATLSATLTVNDSHCEDDVTIYVRTTPPEVPLLTLPGLLALIGMMCIVGAGRIITRGRRS